MEGSYNSTRQAWRGCDKQVECSSIPNRKLLGSCTRAKAHCWGMAVGHLGSLEEASSLESGARSQRLCKASLGGHSAQCPILSSMLSSAAFCHSPHRVGTGTSTSSSG